jgi:hypothetical protein
VFDERDYILDHLEGVFGLTLATHYKYHNPLMPSTHVRSSQKLRFESEYKTPREVPVKPHQKSHEAQEWRKGRNMGIGLGYKEPAVGGGVKDQR